MLTGRHKNHIAKELAALQERSILLQTAPGSGTRPAEWKFNKDWETWLESPNMVTYRKKRNSGKKGGGDPRHQPLVDFFHQNHQQIWGAPLVADASDYRRLKELLRKLPDIPLEQLQHAALEFLGSDDDFHHRQGHPLRYWATNINA